MALYSHSPRLQSERYGLPPQIPISIVQFCLGAKSTRLSAHTAPAHTAQGILALPVVLRDTGLCFGLVLCVIGALLANVSLTMLVTAADAVVYARGLESRRDISYSEIVAVLLGPKMSVVMQVTLFVYCFGTTVGYLLVIGGSIDSFCSATHIALPSPSLPVIIAAAVAFPLTLLRNMGDLAYSSLGAILAMLFTSICIMVRAIQHGSFEGLPNPYIRIAPNFCSSATLVFFAYNCHVNIFSIYSDLKVPLLSRIKKVTSRAVWLELLLYTGVAAAGYLTFGDQTQGNILSSYPNSDTLLVVCKMLVGLALTANLPLGVFPARQSLEELLGYHSTTPDAKSAQRSELNAAQGMDALGGADVKEDDRKGNAAEGDAVIATFSPVNVLLTTFIMGGSLVVALYVPGVDIVFSFLGATVCIVVCYILPSAMYHVVLDSQARRNGKVLYFFHFCASF